MMKKKEKINRSKIFIKGGRKRGGKTIRLVINRIGAE